MILNIILWPFLMIYRLEKKIFELLCKGFSMLNKPIGSSFLKETDAKEYVVTDASSVRHKSKKRYNYVVKNLSKYVGHYKHTFSKDTLPLILSEPSSFLIFTG